MAGKGRLRLEVDIEKYRGDGNWSRVLDLSKQLSVKTPNLEHFVKMVQTECLLERYLLENPPSEKNAEQAARELQDIQKDFLKLLSNNVKLDMSQEILMLLAKVHYTIGDYQGALDRLEEATLDNMSFTDISSRKMKLMGECHAIKGLCLEKLPPIANSRFRQAEREELIIRCFEISGDISLVQLQDRQGLGSGMPRGGGGSSGTATGTTSVPASTGVPWNVSSDADTTGVGPIVETAIQRSPILYIQNGELTKGIGRFRELLRVIEMRSTQCLRQTLARQLAEVLLRGVCERTYQAIDVSLKTADSTHPKPNKFEGERLFVPHDESEETLLLLLISESITDPIFHVLNLLMSNANFIRSFLCSVVALIYQLRQATREALLNRSSELTEARLHTLNNTTAVYDLLTIALVRRSQFSMLSETFERAMRFSCDEYHIWYQFALSLLCSEKFVRAFLVLKECIRMDPTNPVIYLQAAKLCYERLNMISEGIEYCQKVVDMEESHQFMSRGYLFLGIGYSLRAEEARLQSQRQTFQKKAVEALMKSVELDPHDHLAQFHLGLQMALLRQIPEALKYVRRGLQRRSDHLHSVHLLALLLSAQKQFEEAYKLVEATLTEYPDNFSLLLTKCTLELEVSGVENALQTCRTMLLIWKNLFEATSESEERGTGLLERITSDHRSLLQLQLYELSDRDSGSVRAESMAATKLEQTLSEVASSLGSGGNQPRPGPQPTWALHTQIWLQLAELYLSSGKFDSAYACIQEAGSVNPVSHVVSYMRGRLAEAKGDLLDAKKHYESAIAINPSHMKSLHRLGIVLHALGNYQLAEKVVRDAVNFDPLCSQAWQTLGRILQSLDDHDIAADCLLTALELETTDPVQPFNVIPKVFS